MLLVNKYSPKEIRDVLGNNDVVNVLKDINHDFPHLLFTGPPGTGKTTLAHILKQDYDTLELNASDDRGVDVVRTKIKEFCHKQGDRKLVILDECDSLTSAAQQALRRIMEATDTKFILICNRISELIEPIQSRCAVLRFNRVTDDEIRGRIEEICKIEKIKLTPQGFNTLMLLSGGDIRSCLNRLQALTNIDRPVDDDFLYKINGVPSFKSLEKILVSLRGNDIESCLAEFESIWVHKYEAADLMDGFFRVAKNYDDYEILKIIGKYHIRVIEGTSSKTQFYAMFGELLRHLN